MSAIYHFAKMQLWLHPVLFLTTLTYSAYSKQIFNSEHCRDNRIGPPFLAQAYQFFWQNSGLNKQRKFLQKTVVSILALCKSVGIVRNVRPAAVERLSAGLCEIVTRDSLGNSCIQFQLLGIRNFTVFGSRNALNTTSASKAGAICE